MKQEICLDIGMNMLYQNAELGPVVLCEHDVAPSSLLAPTSRGR